MYDYPNAFSKHLGGVGMDVIMLVVFLRISLKLTSPLQERRKINK